MTDNSEGIIIKGVGGLYSVLMKDGNIIVCKPRGIFRKDKIKPTIGDRAVIKGEGAEQVIDTILPRKNELIRPKVANVDRIIFVIATLAPKPDLLLLDKLLLMAEEKSIETVIVINKADQDPKEAENIAEQYKNAVNNVICAALAEEKGAREIQKLVSEGVSVLVGQSGVGKSTLLNLLMFEQVMDTGGLSKKTARGKHTTRHSEMFTTPTGSLVIDSPGFSSYEVQLPESDRLWDFYPELYNNHRDCKFLDCSHTGEPGCFVPELLEKGIFPKERYERYKKIYSEIKEKEKNKYK